MTIVVPRTDTSRLGQWWWTVDRWTLAALAALVAFGALLVMAASPAIAERLDLPTFYFVKRQFLLVPFALAILIGVSLLSPRAIRRLAAIVFLVSLALLVSTLVVGAEIKGAQRWIAIGGFSMQPSEFVKPAFAVVAAWMFAEQNLSDTFPGNIIATAMCFLIVALLIMQPDLGMAVLISVIWFAEFFLAGMPIFWVVLFFAGGVFALIAAYHSFDHVANRIDTFLDPTAGDRYQLTLAHEAFLNGGLFGRGPGEGTVKQALPDAHSDFIFAVAGEELGLLACLIIVTLFAVVLLRGFGRMLQETNLFVLLATTGLLVQFGLQAIINMASTLQLIPTKGMTLPFISYGGSSYLALALGMGMVLALTRRRPGTGDSL
ncbi:MAG: putative lipid II flippase FtsW [Alphaproteobacteria bacterium]|nr:putative lipid II flippase FtsW [Alphaproteobacteria bacterium]